VSIEDVCQFPTPIMQLLLVGFSARGVDSSRLTCFFIMNQVAIVVVQTWKLSDRKDRGTNRVRRHFYRRAKFAAGWKGEAALTEYKAREGSDSTASELSK
jgi:hypothetical protein